MDYNERIKKTVEESSFIPKAFEPKRKNRWLIRFKSHDSFQEWWLSSAQRPKLNNGFWSCIMGYEIEPMTLVFRDPIGESLPKTLFDIFENNVKMDFDLEMLDATGIVIEKWEISKCSILELDYGTLDYSDDSLAEIIVKVKPKKVKIKV